MLSTPLTVSLCKTLCTQSICSFVQCSTCKRTFTAHVHFLQAVRACICVHICVCVCLSCILYSLLGFSCIYNAAHLHADTSSAAPSLVQQHKYQLIHLRSGSAYIHSTDRTLVACHHLLSLPAIFRLFLSHILKSLD